MDRKEKATFELHLGCSLWLAVYNCHEIDDSKWENITNLLR
jgi:hypothetical protein